MPSTASNSLRLQKMATGEKLNTWGSELNSSVIELIEDAIAGYEELTITGNVTLTSTNYATDQARMAMLELGGSPASAFNVTIPAQTKWYLVKNATSVNATMTAGGVGAIVYPGEFIAIMCDGTDVARQEFSRLGQILNAGGFRIENLGAPTADAHAATKKYVDDQDATLLSDVAAAQAAAEAAQAAAETAQSLAETAETNAAASYDSFDDRYLGAKTSDPALDNDGDALITGALIWRSDLGYFKVYNGASWDALPSGTMSAQDADDVNITGGTITGITDLAVADGGTGASTAAGARTNLGLGTIATQAASSVAITGGTINGAAIGGSTPAAGAFTRLTASDGTSTVEVFNSGGVGIVGTDTNHPLDIRTNNLRAITIDTSQQVGIGTSTPSYALEVLGTITAQGGKLYAGGSTVEGDASAPHIGFSLDPDTGMFRANINELGFATGGSEAVRIDSSGNVGIKVTNPSVALDVSGTIKATAIEATPIGGATPEEGTFTTLTTTGITTLGNDLDVGDGNQILLRGVVGQIPLVFDFDTDTGIGRTSIDRLAIYCGGAATVNFDTSWVRFSPQIQAQTGSAAAPGISFDPDSDTGLFRPLTNELGFATGGSEAMRIDTSGNVGIGATSPSGLLHLQDGSSGGTAYSFASQFIIESNAGTGMSILMPDANSGEYGFSTVSRTRAAGIRFNHDNALLDIFTNLSGGIIAFHTTAFSEAMRIDNVGNVGIGTTSPDTLLDLRPIAYTTNQLGGISLQTTGGQLRWDIAVGTSGTGAGFFRITEPSDVLGNTHTIAEHLSDEWAFHTAGSERVRIDNAGNVGIGTTSPATALHVAVSDTSTQGTLRLDQSGTGDVSIRMVVDGQNWAVGVDNSTGNNFAIQNSASINSGAPFTINTNGHVGISTHQPNVELDVNGQIATREGLPLTILSGAITVTHSFHEVVAQGTPASDDLDTINGGHDGMWLVLRADNSAEDTITLTTSGNIVGPPAMPTIRANDTVTLIYSATLSKWVVVAST